MSTPIEISVIVPTFNERDNVLELVSRLERCLAGRAWEVIFVDDDSPDDTAALVRRLAQQDRRVRCLQRIGRRGLSSACVEGMLASGAPVLAVMDGDLQHDEELLPRMLDVLKQGNADVVVGTRYSAGGGVGQWEASRARMSRFATRLSRYVVRADISDPMSGFFALRREAFEAAVRQLSSIGFKILLDLVASSPAPLRICELPYQFRTRRAGESKLDSQAVWEYLMLLVDKLVGAYVPARFVAFAAIGGLGVAVHFVVLAALFGPLHVSFAASQTAAALVAMTSNFALNNALTYRDRRLRGWGWLKGWLSFTLVCSIGLLANVGIAAYLFASQTAWVLAALAGIAVGAVWNYAVTSAYTWRSRARRAVRRQTPAVAVAPRLGPTRAR
ncbi:MAG TPA: glycosyltransferase family 2 protein [Burkholderiales bacterium]|jgi:dolichol-phosphate mannosyltransferase|nr:glycosyltransferase family 2 protein [Burkholderiales bacterium]